MKKIPLTHNKEAIVDDEIYDYLMQWSWNYDTRAGRAVRTEYIPETKKTKIIRMHQIIFEYFNGALSKGKIIDHKNRIKLDNRNENLREATPSQNRANSKKKTNSKNKYKGVAQKKSGKWMAYIGYNKKQIHLGVFDTAEEAHEVYCLKAKELFGEYHFNK